MDKALSIGAVVALDDLPGRGRKREITDEARAWLVSLACRKPTDLGYSLKLWTTALVAQHVSKGDRTYAGERAEPLRVRVHAEARLVAEPGGVVLRQAGGTLLRGIRVDSKDELKERILQHLDWLNADPVVFKWGCGLDDLEAA